VEWIVSLTPEAAPDPVAALAAPPDGAAVVELRADLLPDLDPAAAVAACPLPLLYTLRSRAEGGAGPDDGEERLRLLARARDAGVALLDLEAARDLPALDRLGLDPERVVLSWHDPGGTPPDLARRCRELLSHPARWVKAVPAARSLADLALVLRTLRELSPRARGRRRLLLFATGTTGQASRYLAPLLGPSLGFAAWCEGAAAAPGQVTVPRLEAAIGHLAGPPRRLFAVVGADVSASLSPAMHGAGYRACGLPDAMVPLSVADPRELDALFLPAGSGVLAEAGFPLAGLAVTAPYKERALAAATLAAPRARRARSANTLIPGPGRLAADTTDADGVVAALREAGVDPLGRTVVVQGTGGAGRAAAVGLDLAGAVVVLRGRDGERTAAVAEELGVEAAAPDAWPGEASVAVNATPLGSCPGDPPPFSPREIASLDAVVEMVYGAEPTPLVRAAREAGLAVVDGVEVLLHQGFAQFAAMTGKLPPREAMRAAVRRLAPP